MLSDDLDRPGIHGVSRALSVGPRMIGSGYPCFVVAEIGINHNGDLELAKEAIIAAAEAGADAVKFQNYHTEDFICDRNLTLHYRSQGREVVESQYELFKRCELSRDQLAALKDLADRHGIDLHSTPTSVVGLQDLKDIGCSIVKNGSDYLTNISLIRAMGQSGLLTVLSTGMATAAEIDIAVRAFRETGNELLVILHCTSSYPTPPEDVNLARLAALATAFDVPVGFSDHSVGTTAAVGAVVLGACWVEKHFTVDRDLPGPDHWFSMDPGDLRRLVTAVRDVERMVGSPRIEPTPSEALGRRDYRLSCVAARDMAMGDEVTLADIVFQRPGDGIAPLHVDLLVGLKLRRPLNRGEQIRREHFHD